MATATDRETDRDMDRWLEIWIARLIQKMLAERTDCLTNGQRGMR